MKILAWCLSGLLCVAAAEAASRAFWHFHADIPFGRPERILQAFYPELGSVDDHPAHGDGFYDVLLLGGSVMNRDWAPVEAELGEQLAFEGHRNVRIYNLAAPSLNSRDSLLKYQALGEDRFDVVIVYDGINDTRTNNVPPALFRDDYGHMAWYETVNALAPYQGSATFALPYTLRYLGLAARQRFSPGNYIAGDRPRAEWIQYGADLRSTNAFGKNFGALLDLAASRKDPVLLMTFAIYVPENYSLDAFEAKRLDYGLHLIPIEAWGDKDNVLKAVAAQNEVVRKLAGERKQVLFVDQAALLAGSARDFNDPCHLTVAGAQAFVRNVLDVLRPQMGK